MNRRSGSVSIPRKSEGDISDRSKERHKEPQMSMRLMIPTERSISRRHSSSDLRGYWHLPHFRASRSVSAPQLGHFGGSAIANPSYPPPPSPVSQSWWPQSQDQLASNAVVCRKRYGHCLGKSGSRLMGWRPSAWQDRRRVGRLSGRTWPGQVWRSVNMTRPVDVPLGTPLENTAASKSEVASARSCGLLPNCRPSAETQSRQ